MKKHLLTKVLLSACLALLPSIASAEYLKKSLKVNNTQDRQQDRAQDRRQDSRQDHRQDVRQVHRKIDRRRAYRNVLIVRPHGGVYSGYGRFYNDNEAYKWLAFTAITLKILDNINEDAQRKHEAAQVTATLAPVGEKIQWHSADSSGYVVTVKEGSRNGLVCREFQQNITVGHKVENAYGTACLQADGSWKIV